MARPCDCDGPCLGGRYGAYTVLVHRAQADTDPARRQQAMDYLAKIGPMAGSIGADGSCPGDGLAAPMISKLYPDEKPQPGPEVHDVIAEIEAAGVKRFEQFLADARRNAALGPAETGASSDQR
jgi:hypothetical protein